jgi:hypothetical protein
MNSELATNSELLEVDVPTRKQPCIDAKTASHDAGYDIALVAREVASASVVGTSQA